MHPQVEVCGSGKWPRKKHPWVDLYLIWNSYEFGAKHGTDFEAPIRLEIWKETLKPLNRLYIIDVPPPSSEKQSCRTLLYQQPRIRFTNPCSICLLYRAECPFHCLGVRLGIMQTQQPSVSSFSTITVCLKVMNELFERLKRRPLRAGVYPSRVRRVSLLLTCR